MITFLSWLDWVGCGESLQIFFSCWWNSLTYITNSTGNKLELATFHDITLPDIMMFLALALRMGHDVTEKLQDSWSRLE